ncbi:MAG TPA: GntR family transcriptional regulator [Eoetvoesiella sp.]
MRSSNELDRSRYAAPQLYDLLRQKIVSLEMLPGAPLSRVQLSAQFSVSQTPVREALLKLAEERLVDVFPQAATNVSLIDIEFAQETHFLRLSLELEIVRELAIKNDAALVAELKLLLSRQSVLCDNEDFDGFTLADEAFHRSMYSAVGKEALWRLVRSRSGHIDRLRRLHLPVVGKLNRIFNDHSRIVAAIEQGDPALAQQSLRAHLSETLAYAAQIRTDHPQFFTTP